MSEETYRFETIWIIVILPKKSGDILDTIENLQLQSPEWRPVFGCSEAFKDIQYTIELFFFFFHFQWSITILTIVFQKQIAKYWNSLNKLKKCD